MKVKRLEKSGIGDDEEDDIENCYKIVVLDVVDRFLVSYWCYMLYFFFLFNRVWLILGGGEINKILFLFRRF